MGRRLLRVVAVVAGWLLVAAAAIAIFSAPDTSRPPVVSCHGPAIVLVFSVHVADQPEGRAADCQNDARDLLLGGSVLLAAGSALLLTPRVVRKRRAARVETLAATVPAAATVGASPAGARSAVDGAAPIPPSTEPSLAWLDPVPAPLEPAGRGWFGIAPVWLTIDSPLAVDDAVAALRSYGDGRSVGALKARVDASYRVVAFVVGREPKKLRGRLQVRGDGSQLSGTVRVGPEVMPQVLMGALAVGALVLAAARAVAGDLAFGAAVGALAFGMMLFAWGLHALTARQFPGTVNALSDALAEALGAHPPHVPATPLSPRARRNVTVLFVGLQAVILPLRFAIHLGVAGVVVGVALELALGGAIAAVTLYWRVQLDGDVLSRGGHRVRLSMVDRVTARGSALTLGDGVDRVVLPIARGRARDAQRARAKLAGSDATERDRRAAADLLAVDAAIDRVPLDASTAHLLQRRATPGVEPVERAPRTDPSGRYALIATLAVVAAFGVATIVAANAR